jgi:hypothetical protein
MDILMGQFLEICLTLCIYKLSLTTNALSQLTPFTDDTSILISGRKFDNFFIMSNVSPSHMIKCKNFALIWIYKYNCICNIQYELRKVSTKSQQIQKKILVQKLIIKRSYNDS